MSNLQNTIIEEKLWEDLNILVEKDEAFATVITRRVEEQGLGHDDDLGHNTFNYMEDLFNAMLEECQESTPYTLKEVKELAYEVLGIKGEKQ